MVLFYYYLSIETFIVFLNINKKKKKISGLKKNKKKNKKISSFTLIARDFSISYFKISK